MFFNSFKYFWIHFSVRSLRSSVLNFSITSPPITCSEIPSFVSSIVLKQHRIQFYKFPTIVYIFFFFFKFVVKLHTKERSSGIFNPSIPKAEIRTKVLSRLNQNQFFFTNFIISDQCSDKSLIVPCFVCYYFRMKTFIKYSYELNKRLAQITHLHEKNIYLELSLRLHRQRIIIDVWQ